MLQAQVEYLQSELQHANEELDHNFSRLEAAGLSAVNLAEKLATAEDRIGQLEDEIRALLQRNKASLVLVNAQREEMRFVFASARHQQVLIDLVARPTNACSRLSRLSTNRWSSCRQAARWRNDACRMSTIDSKTSLTPFAKRAKRRSRFIDARSKWQRQRQAMKRNEQTDQLQPRSRKSTISNG